MLKYHTHLRWKALTVNLVLIDACKRGNLELVKAMLDCRDDADVCCCRYCGCDAMPWRGKCRELKARYQ